MLKNIVFLCILIVLSSSSGASSYYVIFLGPPGSEKSTQTVLMVPENLAVRLLWKELKNKTCEQGCILDGTSRSLSQAKMLIKQKNQGPGQLQEARLIKEKQWLMLVFVNFQKKLGFCSLKIA